MIFPRSPGTGNTRPERIMKKILGLTIAIVLAVGIIGTGTLAYFIDTESSTDNVFTAGTLDLKTNDADGISEVLNATNIAPGDTIGPAGIELRNAGSTDGTNLDIVFSYVESDADPNPVDMSDNQTAGQLMVTVLEYKGTSLLGIVDDFNENDYIDIYDLMMADLTDQTGIMAGETEDFRIEVQLVEDTGNDFQADGIVLTMTFVLRQ